MNFADISAGYTPRETSFSSLLAKENIFVTFDPRATSASFHLETRALTLPVYKKDVPDFLVDTLIYHEVAHALYSDKDEWVRLVTKHGQSATNIFEDVFIEHAIKLDYPGAARIMPKGHLWKYDHLFNEDLDSQSFLTRFIAHFKTAGLLPVQFNERERAFNHKIKSLVDSGATTADLLREWEDFKKQEEERQKKEQEEQEEQQEQDEGPSDPQGDENDEEPEESEDNGESENEPGEDDSEPEPTEGDDSEPESGEDEDEEPAEPEGDGDSESDEDEEPEESEGSGESDEEGEESEEDEGEEDAEGFGDSDDSEDEDEPDDDEAGEGSTDEDDLEDEESDSTEDDPMGDGDGYSDDDPEDESDDPAENYSSEEEVKEPDESELFKETERSDQIVTFEPANIEALVHNTEYDLSDYWNECKLPRIDSDGIGSAAYKRYKEFDQETTSAAREMFAQFNQLADARSLDNQSEYDSGEIDIDLITEYRTRDDIFSQEVMTEGGVNHGFFNLLDFSISMFPSGGTSKVKYHNTQFYAVMRQVTVMAKFCQMAGLPYRCYAFTGAPDRIRPKDFVRNTTQDAISDRFGLCNFFHDSMNTAEYQTSLDRVMYLGANAFKARAGNIVRSLMSGTPLAESIMAIPKLVSGMNCEKLSVVILTDGQAGTMRPKEHRTFSSYKFVVPQFSASAYGNSVSGVAQFVNDILPNAHITYYFVSEIAYPGKRTMYDHNFNLQKFGATRQDYNNTFEADIKPLGILSIDPEPYMGFDAIFFVNPHSGPKTGSFEGDKSSAVASKLSRSSALAEFQGSNLRAQIEKQFASDFIRNVA